MWCNLHEWFANMSLEVGHMIGADSIVPRKLVRRGVLEEGLVWRWLHEYWTSLLHGEHTWGVGMIRPSSMGKIMGV